LGETSHSTVNEDSLQQIDQIVDHWSHLRQESAEEQAHSEVEREHFLKDFQDITNSVIRPTMEMAIERLRTDGGDGLIEERHLDALHKPRVTLWMSMQGEVANPRQDLNPFLQLDADMVNRRINVWEGDMVENQGTSRATSPWSLPEVTPESIMDRIVDVLRRAGTHGVA
jgi:nucleotidyltransferase/DNA polymerase involved in DNA repair